MQKNLSNEIAIIKFGLARDCSDTFCEKIRFILKKQDISDLNKCAVERLLGLNKEEINNEKILMKIHLNKLCQKNNYVPQYAFAIISAIISIFSIILSFLTACLFNTIGMYKSDYNFTEKEISDILNENINAFMSQIIPELFFIVLILLTLSIVISYIINKRKCDSIIYYSFVMDCINIAEEKITFNESEQNECEISNEILSYSNPETN